MKQLYVYKAGCLDQRAEAKQGPGIFKGPQTMKAFKENV